VNGERTKMSVGDFIITPSNSWHDHGNESDEPIFWLDGLDVPLVTALDASFLEHWTSDEQPISRPEGDSLARFGANLLPVDQKTRNLTSPVFNYPYARTREALEVMRKTKEFDPCHGLKMRYTNPETGDHAMPTIGAFIQLLPKGFTTSRYRSTDATVFTVVEGKGRTKIGDQTFDWKPQDIFVAPSWYPVVHEADDDAVIFSFSDRPVQEKLGLFRENRGNA
jgi:gentisate 1,2-dioxygenase